MSDLPDQLEQNLIMYVDSSKGTCMYNADGGFKCTASLPAPADRVEKMRNARKNDDDDDEGCNSCH